MVGLSTNARLMSASLTPSPSRTARATSRMRARSGATISCGTAMAILPMSPSVRERPLGLRLALDADHAGVAALVHLHARRQHGRRRLAEHLARQCRVVLGAVAVGRVAEDR